MPQVKDKSIGDSWYRNTTNRLLSLGTVTFKPGQERWVPARVRSEARFTNASFVAALDNGSLVAVPKTADAPATPVAVAKTAPPAVEPAPPAVEPVPPEVDERERLKAMPKSELVALAIERGIDEIGSKSQLVDRLMGN